MGRISQSVSIQVLGHLQLVVEDRVVALPQRLAPLLAYLALYAQAGRSVTRTRLAGTLWPEQSDTQARHSLSDALYRLRQVASEAGGSEWLAANDETIWLEAVRVDVDEFGRLSQSDQIESLEKAIELYSGDLLLDLYEEWVSAPRLEYRDKYLALLETLTESFQAKNELRPALHYARRLVMAEPFREYSQQIYLRLLGRLGRRTEAIAHYEHLRHLLQTELAVEPLPETQAVVAAIQREVAEHKPVPVEAEQLPFVGRTPERARAIEKLESTLAGRGTLLAIEGSAGIGKSRFLRELRQSAQWRGLTVLTGKASETPLASPLAPLADALRPLVESRRAQLETILPSETLAALEPLSPLWRDQASLPTLPPEHQQYRFHQAIIALLTALTRLSPLLLLLDDLHWADPVIWQVLKALEPYVPQIRLCLALTYRRPEIERGAGWHTLLEWERAGKLNVLSLTPLSLSDYEAALPVEYKSNAQHLWALTGGNPFLLTGALDSLAEGRAPDTDIAARAVDLPAETRTALECAAVLGVSISFPLWARLVNISPYALAEAGDALTRRHFLQPSESGYTFTHDLIQSNLYTGLDPAHRQQLHERAADALAELDPDNDRLRAFHADRAGRLAEAVTLYHRSAERDLARSAYAEAWSGLSRALDLLPAEASHERVELLLAFAQTTFIVREGEGLAAIIAETLQLVDQLNDAVLQARAALLAGELAMKTGQEAEALKHFERALTHAQSADNLALQGETLNLLGEVSWRLGTLPVARDYYEQQLTLARQIGDRAQEGAALEGVAFVLASTGEQSEVLRHMRESLTIRRALGDRYREAQATNSLISALQAAGQMDQVLTLGPDAVALNESIGYARGASIARAALGMTHAALGNYDQACELITATIAYFAAVKDATAEALYIGTLGYVTDRSGDPGTAEGLLQKSLAGLQANQAEFFAALTLMDLATLYIRQARYAEARPVLESAIAVFKANDAPMEWQRSLALLGIASYHTGDYQQAEALADETWAVFKSAPPNGEDRQYYLRALWKLNTLLGRMAEARTALAEAHATLQRQANLINDSTLRDQFLRRVAINREIEEAFEKQSAPTGRLVVRLARADAPLGITLTDNHLITVRWTVDDGAEDAVVFEQSGKAGLRRHRLRRLIAEAGAQNAAPTDSDLAAALGVARRTIERDMATLSDQGESLPTRRRKS